VVAPSQREPAGSCIVNRLGVRALRRREKEIETEKSSIAG